MVEHHGRHILLFCHGKSYGKCCVHRILILKVNGSDKGNGEIFFKNIYH